MSGVSLGKAAPGDTASIDKASESTKPEKAKRKRVKYPPLPWKERGWRLGLMTLAGVLTFLSFPFTTERDTNLWPLAWVALVPFFEGIRGLRGKQAFWFGSFAGLVTNLGGFWWISEVLREFGHLPGYIYWPATLLNSFYQGLMIAFIALFVARAAKRRPDGLVPVWQVAAIWTVVEWLFPMIFPWYFANSQYRFLPAIQIAELFGVMSISFVMVAFNAGLHRLWVHRALRNDPARPELPRRALLITFIGTALVLIYGQVRIGMVDSDIAAAEKVKLGLVEADIGIFEKQAKHLPPREQALTLHRNLLKHQTMSAELEKLGVDLVIWPESSYFPLDDPFIKRTDRMALGIGKGGTLVEWAYDPASDSFSWRPIKEGVEGIAGATALAVMREDLFVALGPTVSPSAADAGKTNGLLGTNSKLPPGEFTAIALASAPGYSEREDHAKASVWVAGKAGALAFGRLGEPLAQIPSGVTQNLNAIAMRTGRDGVVVGDDGTILEIEHEKARLVEATISPAAAVAAAFRAVAWGHVPELGQLALAVGDKGTIAVRLEKGWQVERLPGEVDLGSIAFDRHGQPWIAGKGGFVAVRTGGVWRETRIPEASDVLALTVDPLGAVLASDASGGLWTRPEGATTWQQAVGEGVTPVTPVTPVTMMASADWVQAMPLPRDTRWVRQSTVALPTLAEFDADPSAEIGDVAEEDRTGIQRGFSTPILLGGLTWAPPLPGKSRRQLYNTALLLDQRGRLLGTYDKVYLLAFGEYMPFGDTFPGLYDAFPQAGRFSAGNEVKAFSWKGHKLGIMICYEDIMVDFTGKLADLSPNVIINVTNDAWFGRTAEPWLHLALAAFRAVENRLTLVRATNTGISAFIDPTGRLVGATKMVDAETLTADVPMMQGGTLYGVIGNLFAWLLFAGLIAHAAYGWRRRQAATVDTKEGAS